MLFLDLTDLSLVGKGLDYLVPRQRTGLTLVRIRAEALDATALIEVLLQRLGGGPALRLLALVG